MAVPDVARVIAAILADPQRHVGRTYHLTGPESGNMQLFAGEYSKALGRGVSYQEIPSDPWRARLLERGLPDYLVNHLAMMADLHRARRYDRMSGDVLALTGQPPMTVQQFGRNNAAAITGGEPGHP